LSFSVQPGCVTGFLGPNGAGKTTTMGMMLGLMRPTSGQALVNGVPYASLRDPLHAVGALLDARAVHGGRRARDHLRWLAQTNGIPRRRVDEVLGVTGLEGVANRRVGKFSLGMAQRLGIAAALLGDPAVLMFDEPVNGLDPEGIRWIRGFLQGLAAEGRTVLVSSHLMSEMALTAERLVVIGRGRLIVDASVQDVIERGDTRTVRVRTPQTAQLCDLLAGHGTSGDPKLEEDGALLLRGVAPERVGEMAAAHGVVLHELVALRPTLEEAFMDLTETSVEYTPTVSSSLECEAQ
jgi:ABC-2 type transport system ATP-binding protein